MFPELLKLGIDYIVVPIIGVQAWTIMRLIKLEIATMKREDIDHTVNTLRRDIKEGNASINSRLDRWIERKAFGGD